MPLYGARPISSESHANDEYQSDELLFYRQDSIPGPEASWSPYTLLHRVRLDRSLTSCGWEAYPSLAAAVLEHAASRFDLSSGREASRVQFYAV